MTSRGQCPRGGGGACECPRWGGVCFSISRRVDDVTRTMSKEAVLVNVFTPPPPPSGNPVSAPG